MIDPDLQGAELDNVIPLNIPEPDEELAPMAPAELFTELKSFVEGGMDIADALGDELPSRELSLVKTKLQEAWLWMSQIDAPEPTQEAA